jgi:hypothetical protein
MSMAAQQDHTPDRLPLEYSRTPTLAWLRRWRWRLLLLICASAVAIPIFVHRESLSQRIAWLYWSRQCASFRVPENVDLIVTDPKRVAELLATNPDYVPRTLRLGEIAPIGGKPPPPVAYYSPRVWRKLEGIDGRCDALSNPRIGDESIAFLGTLRRPDGVDRLVVLRGADTNGHDLLAFTKALVLPRPNFRDPLPKRASGGMFAYSGLWCPARLRGGVADPADPSHVTFEFAVYDFEGDGIKATGTIDAYLRNDDSISFKLRETPELAKLRVKIRRNSVISGVIPKPAMDGILPARR